MQETKKEEHLELLTQENSLNTLVNDKTTEAKLQELENKYSSVQEKLESATARLQESKKQEMLLKKTTDDEKAQLENELGEIRKSEEAKTLVLETTETKFAEFKLSQKNIMDDLEQKAALDVHKLQQQDKEELDNLRKAYAGYTRGDRIESEEIQRLREVHLEALEQLRSEINDERAIMITKQKQEKKDFMEKMTNCGEMTTKQIIANQKNDKVYKAKVEALEDKVERYSKQMQTSLLELNAKSDEARQLEIFVAQLRQQEQMLTTKNAEIQAQYIQDKQIFDDQKKRLDQMRTELEENKSATGELSTVKNEVFMLKARQEQSRSELEEVRQELKNTHDANVIAEDSVRDIYARVRVMGSPIIQTQMQLTDSADTMEKLKQRTAEELGRVASLLEAQKSVNNEHQTKLKRISDETVLVVNKLQSLSADNSDAIASCVRKCEQDVSECADSLQTCLADVFSDRVRREDVVGVIQELKSVLA